ncbi:hypothetical protein [Amycolatopsis sp. NPDC051716]|uniref:hypothetical protein n=1 Tax=Amycolatopsis sp. NPDC051716 TaxID=3155804 RepID=UPI0034366846
MSSELKELAGRLDAAAEQIPQDVAAALTEKFDATIALCQGIVSGTGHEEVVERLQAIREHLTTELTLKLAEARQALKDTAGNIVRGG